MYKIDSEKFEQSLLRFMGCILTIQDNAHYQHSTKISFQSGFLYEAEGYKQDVWAQAQSILQKDPAQNAPRYLPVRPQAMEERFQTMGIQSDCLSGGCTWKHYQEYIQILCDVQKRLMCQFESEVSLLDAHSFVWSMWILDEVAVSNLPQQFDALEKEAGSLQGGTRDTVIKARVNQSVFRERLLGRYHKCCLCGVSNPDLLTASHIKPWADSSPLEKSM